MMEKEQNQDSDKTQSDEIKNENISSDTFEEKNQNNEEIKEKSPEDKILELEDKLTRTYAEMEKKRRKFEKEKK